MKKLIFAISAIAFINISASAQQVKEDEKAKMIKEIKSEMLADMTSNGLTEFIAKPIVDCFGDEINEKMTLQDLKDMQELDKIEEGQEPTEEQQKMIERLQPKMANLGTKCFEGLDAAEPAGE